MSANIRLLPCAAAFAVAAVIAIPGAAAADLATVKGLYASASYEEALSELASLDPSDDHQIEQYRALCFIALDRVNEAERSLERLVTRNPLYRMEDGEISPRLVGLYRDVRKRMLPAAARERYEAGKRSFERQNFGDAADHFKTLLAILADVDPVGADLADFRQLGEGFLRLIEAGAVGMPRPAVDSPKAVASAIGATGATGATGTTGAGAPATPPAAAPPTASAAVVPTRLPAVYSAADSTVIAPVELERTLPRYTPPRSLAHQSYRGTLSVVVDERGTVESVSLAKPTSPQYDDLLLNAAKKWRFRPATKDGRPVKYRKVVDIVLLPRS